jgi:hypothetical protein
MRTLLITAVILLAGCNGGVPGRTPVPLTDEEIALNMQCHDRHGLLAMGHGPQGEWIDCYQGKKKIWSVRLRRL